jgi:hypothetical protein
MENRKENKANGEGSSKIKKLTLSRDRVRVLEVRTGVQAGSGNLSIPCSDCTGDFTRYKG